MKKIVILLLLCGFWGSAMAQQLDTERIRFGFQMSPSFSWMNTNNNRISSQGTNLGLRLGMIGEYYFAENYALTSGLGFHFNTGGTLFHEDKGVYWTRTDLLQDTIAAGGKLKYNLQFLEIPISLKMRTREFGFMRYYLEPGIAIGFNTQSRGTVTASGYPEDEKINISEEVNNLNISWGVGGGVEYSLSSNTTLVGGLLVRIGFTDITDDNGKVLEDRSGPLTVPKDEDSKGSISSLTLRLGIIF